MTRGALSSCGLPPRRIRRACIKSSEPRGILRFSIPSQRPSSGLSPGGVFALSSKARNLVCAGRKTANPYARSLVAIKNPATVGGLLLRFRFRPLVRLLQVLAGFFEGAEGVVVGLQGLAVFVDRALALSCDIENLAQLNAAPDFGPARLAVPVDRFPV